MTQYHTLGRVKTPNNVDRSNMASKTLFQRIADREVPAEILHEDEICVAFRDINPQAPVHILIVPRRPIVSTNDLVASDAETVGRLFVVAAELAAAHGIAADGYRAVINCGQFGQQSVPHLHVHLLGGRQMAWPPG